MRFQILMLYPICGRMCECWAEVPTASGDFFICYSEEEAKQRVKELHELGHTSARYEELPLGESWIDDPGLVR